MMSSSVMGDLRRINQLLKDACWGGSCTATPENAANLGAAVQLLPQRHRKLISPGGGGAALRLTHPTFAVPFPQAGLFCSIHFTQGGKADGPQRFQRWDGL
jgi:hypothetical protein